MARVLLMLRPTSANANIYHRLVSGTFLHPPLEDFHNFGAPFRGHSVRIVCILPQRGNASMPRWSVWKLNTPPCTWFRWWSASGPHRYGRPAGFGAGCWISIQKQSYWLTSLHPTSFCLPPSANRHCTGGWPADQREAVLRPVHVWGHPNSSARLLGGPNLARAAA